MRARLAPLIVILLAALAACDSPDGREAVGAAPQPTPTVPAIVHQPGVTTAPTKPPKATATRRPPATQRPRVTPTQVLSPLATGDCTSMLGISGQTSQLEATAPVLWQELTTRFSLLGVAPRGDSGTIEQWINDLCVGLDIIGEDGQLLTALLLDGAGNSTAQCEASGFDLRTLLIAFDQVIARGLAPGTTNVEVQIDGTQRTIRCQK